MTSNAQNTNPQLSFSERLTAIDAMRGIVMVLMALDHASHASHAFNAGRFVRDSAAWWVPGTEIPAVQFLLRWVTHLCAWYKKRAGSPTNPCWSSAAPRFSFM